MQNDYTTWGLDEAQAMALLAQYDAGYSIAIPVTEAGLQEMRDISLALILSKRSDDAYVLREQLHQALLASYATQPDAAFIAEHLLDSLSQHLRTLPYEPNQFAPYTQLHPLIQQFAQHQGRFVYLHHRARATLRTMYAEWPLNGGQPDSLPADMRSYLDTLSSQYFEELSHAADAQRSDAELWWALMNLLAEEYFHDALPNDALRVRKAVVQAWQQNDAVPAHLRAEAAYYLAMLYSEYEKWQQALPYYEQAKLLYTEAGSQYEPFMWQAEGWVEHCQNMLNA